MCGIFGQYKQAGADPHLIERMAKTLEHRGPDGFGIAHRGALAFGAGRLAIIDLTAPAGAIFNEDNQIGIVFNGEIYNHQALREELKKAGHQFQTLTDTEVIVHGYEEWGYDVLQHLRGMFAFCIYDARDESLFLARDRIGEKPLYYLQREDGEMLFASEIKAFFEHPEIQPCVNQDMLAVYLSLGYVPPPHTMFSGIQKLAPAHFLILRNGHIHIDRYWSATTDKPDDYPDYETATQQVRDALQTTVASRMVSDVPVGAFLSGGVDSSAVVALMQQMTNTPVQTFTVGFDFEQGTVGDEKFNVDLYYAQKAAEHIGTEHHAITIKQHNLGEFLPHFVYQIDEPLAQHSIIQSTYVSALARSEKIPVLLTGDAGDELFLGYSHYPLDKRLDAIMKLPRPIREKVLAPLLARIKRLNDYVPKILADDPVARYLEWMRFMRLEDAYDLLQSQSENTDEHLRASFYPALNQVQTPHFAERIAYASLNLWVPEVCNMRVDKTSMLMSVEARAPLEDHDFVDMALRLPLKYKLRNGDFKRVFKDSVRDLLPESILNRGKWGFIPPTSDWLRTEFRPLVDTYLSREYVEAAGMCNPIQVSRLVDEHMSRSGYHLKPLWALLVLHLWHALYISGNYTLSYKLTPEMLVEDAAVSRTLNKPAVLQEQ